MCDPQNQDFSKNVRQDTFTFCVSPIPHACPVQLIPKLTKEMSEKNNLTFTFSLFIKIQQKDSSDFWLRWLFPSFN